METTGEGQGEEQGEAEEEEEDQPDCQSSRRYSGGSDRIQT